MCPRCRGRLIAERDQYGAYHSCLACGYVQEDSPAPLPLLSGPTRPATRIKRTTAEIMDDARIEKRRRRRERKRWRV